MTIPELWVKLVSMSYNYHEFKGEGIYNGEGVRVCSYDVDELINLIVNLTVEDGERAFSPVDSNTEYHEKFGFTE